MNLIKQQVFKVIQYSQGFSPDAVGGLIDDWYAAKKDFIKAFGGELIIQGPKITCSIPKEVKQKRFDDFVNMIDSVYDDVALVDFLCANEASFYDNVVTASTIPEVPVGMKLLKAFKHFGYGENALRHLQDEASKLLQEDRLTGTLCLSVHPLDYLSMSESNHKWRSCHSLDGEFRAGNLSYMCDSSTVICYLKSEKEGVILPNFPSDIPWNSKKWRALLHFSEERDMVFLSKHYPFHMDEMMGHVAALMKEVPLFAPLVTSSPFQSTVWRSDVISEPDLWSDYLKVYGFLVPTHDLITEAQPVLQYNDVVRSNKYTPTYALNPRGKGTYDSSYVPHFSIGATVTCPMCGDRVVDDTEAMCCSSCWSTIHYDGDGECEFCGGQVYGEPYYLDGFCVCEQCYEENAYVCPRCEHVIIHSDRVYHEGTDEYYCQDCYDEIIRGD